MTGLTNSSDNEALQRAVRKMRARGSNLKGIAKHFGISMETARYVLPCSNRTDSPTKKAEHLSLCRLVTP